MLLVWECCRYSVVEGHKTYISHLAINKRDDRLADGSDLREGKCNNMTLHRAIPFPLFLILYLVQNKLNLRISSLWD